MDIKNFIPVYPWPDDKNVVEKLTHLKELYDFQIPVTENVPREPGIPLTHQELAARIFSGYTPFRKGLIKHGTGLGKSCLISFIIERYKAFKIKNNLAFKPALILVKNSALRDNIRNEIANVCTKSVYTPSATKAELSKLAKNQILDISEQTKIHRLNKAISRTYNILTYGELLDTDKFRQMHY
jgi:superfamily II DNA or RNA helicase